MGWMRLIPSPGDNWRRELGVAVDRTPGGRWIPAFAGMTAQATGSNFVRSYSVSFGLQRYLDAGRDRADLGAFGASGAAVFEDDEGSVVVPGSGAYCLLGAGFYAGAASGTGVRDREDGPQERYPLGVTMRPAAILVWELPTTTMVSMSTSSGRREARSVSVTRCVGR